MLVQKLRLHHGWSQEQLAELSGVSVRTIQRIEQGKPASAESINNLGALENTVIPSKDDMRFTHLFLGYKLLNYHHNFVIPTKVGTHS